LRFDRKPAVIEVDGRAFAMVCIDSSDCAVLLPRGEHGVLAR
jgi:hypothetical protein